MYGTSFWSRMDWSMSVFETRTSSNFFVCQSMLFKNRSKLRVGLCNLKLQSHSQTSIFMDLVDIFRNCKESKDLIQVSGSIFEKIFYSGTLHRQIRSFKSQWMTPLIVEFALKFARWESAQKKDSKPLYPWCPEHILTQPDARDYHMEIDSNLLPTL